MCATHDDQWLLASAEKWMFQLVRESAKVLLLLDETAKVHAAMPFQVNLVPE